MRLKRIETFADRYPLLGPLFWVVSVQYFIVQWVVASRWPVNFSVSSNPISDLGNTACAIYSGRNVCSPLFALMNASFITLGITMIVGSVLIYHEFKQEDVGSAAGFGGMAIAGLGGILIGLFPENTIYPIHLAGTFAAIGVGSLGMLLLGGSLELPKGLRYFTIISSLVSLIGLTLVTTKIFLGIGYGGMERVAAYPQTIWLIVFGMYMTRNRFMPAKAKSGSR
jgi:hypothetical membrane protein